MTALVGVDVGGTKSAVVLGRRRAEADVEVVERVAFATETDRGPAHALGRIREGVVSLVERARAGGTPVSAVGVSCGGPLDSRRGVVLSPPNLPGWDGVPIVAMLHEATRLPVRLENDANAGALAEWLFGAGRGTRSMVFCTFGTGFGSGLVLDGRLYSGANDNAGEIGHVRLADEGPAGYGKRGSVEGFCSGGGIAQLAHAYAVERLQRGETVGFCRSLADVLNPERIVLGSIFARQHAFIWPECERVLREEALAPALAVCKVVPAELGERIGDLAALAVAMEAGREERTMP